MVYELDKRLWTQEDFGQMGWHDNHIYKIKAGEDLELDIDYILKWNTPDLEGLPFTFWIAPATLAFKKITTLSFEIDTLEADLEIQDIERETINNEVIWTIMTHQGNFQFLCEGYDQFIRQSPFFEFGQTINFIERGGFSLERTLDQRNPNRFREDFEDRRKKEDEQYENVKKRHLKRQEKEGLEKSRSNKEISTKDYLLKKKEIKEMLFYYDYWLKGTRFENY